MPENTDERIFYISDNTNEEYIPCSNWYGNNKKRLVDVAYEDNYDYAEEKYSFTKKELYSMIEELRTKNN